MECQYFQQQIKQKKSSYFLRCDMISFSSISKKFKFWPRKDSQRKEKERGKLKKKSKKKKNPKNQNHPALIGMKIIKKNTIWWKTPSKKQN